MWEFADKNAWWEKRITEIRFDFVISFLVNAKLKMNWAQNPFQWMMSLCNAYIFIPLYSRSLSLLPLQMPFIHSFIHTRNQTRIQIWNGEKNQMNHTEIPTIWINYSKRFRIFKWIVRNHVLKITKKNHFNTNVRRRFLFLLHPKIDILLIFFPRICLCRIMNACVSLVYTWFCIVILRKSPKCELMKFSSKAHSFTDCNLRIDWMENKLEFTTTRRFFLE